MTSTTRALLVYCDDETHPKFRVKIETFEERRNSKGQVYLVEATHKRFSTSATLDVTATPDLSLRFRD
jgi:hypothetical protein